MKKIIIPFIFLIILSSVVLGKVEVQTNTFVDENSLVIVYPHFLDFPENTNINLSFDILNSSNARLNNSQVDCIFFMVDNIGINQSSGTLDYYNYWFKEIPSLEQGYYSFYVHCNSTQHEYGFVSQSLHISREGNMESEDSEDKDSRLFIIFAYCFCIIFLIIGAWKQDRTFLSLSGIGFVIIGIWIATNGFLSLDNYLTQTIATISIGLGIVIFILTNLEWLEENF